MHHCCTSLFNLVLIICLLFFLMYCMLKENNIWVITCRYMVLPKLVFLLVTSILVVLQLYGKHRLQLCKVSMWTYPMWEAGVLIYITITIFMKVSTSNSCTDMCCAIFVVIWSSLYLIYWSRLYLSWVSLLHNTSLTWILVEHFQKHLAFILTEDICYRSWFSQEVMSFPLLGLRWTS